MNDLYFVRCSEARWNGEPCMTIYPAANPRHIGPCVYCVKSKNESLLAKQELARFLEQNPSQIRFDEPEEFK